MSSVWPQNSTESIPVNGRLRLRTRLRQSLRPKAATLKKLTHFNRAARCHSRPERLRKPRRGCLGYKRVGRSVAEVTGNIFLRVCASTLVAGYCALFAPARHITLGSCIPDKSFRATGMAQSSSLGSGAEFTS